MPFRSEKQRRYLYANEPKLAKKWSNMYGKKIIGLGNMSAEDILDRAFSQIYKQGYKDREDESLGMRRGAEKGKKQSYKDRRNESYGKFGKRDFEKRGKNKINITGLGAVKPTIYEIKRMTFDKLPYFFDKNTMKFYGQRLSDFKVIRSPKGKIYIYARIAKDEGGGYSFHEFKNNDLKPIPTFFDTLDKVKKYISKN